MIDIACAADEAYAPHCAAMLHSVLSAVPPAEVRIHFLHSPNFAEAARQKLRGMVEDLGGAMVFHHIDDARVAGLPGMGRIPQLMWYRVLLPELLPQVERVLYLDCDIIVIDDLRILFEMELGDRYLGAVNNVFDVGMERRATELGLDNPRQYFNSGVLLMNLAAWRKDQCSTKIVQYARDHAASLLWPDQDALNLVLGRRRLALHPRWNCQNSYYYFAHAQQTFEPGEVAQACRDPGILHFEGPGFAKPWHYLCKHPRRAEYFRHLRQTPWPQPVIEGRTWRNRLFKPLPMNLLLPALRLAERVERGLRRRLGMSPS